MTVDAAQIPTPTTIAEAIASLHISAEQMATASDALLELAELREVNPELHTVVINEANNGQYQVTDRATWEAKSIGVYNPGTNVVFVGVGGVSPTLQSRAISVPGASAVVLPVKARELQFGCVPADLGAATAVLYVFRYHSLQPLVLRQVP